MEAWKNKASRLNKQVFQVNGHLPSPRISEAEVPFLASFGGSLRGNDGCECRKMRLSLRRLPTRLHGIKFVCLLLRSRWLRSLVFDHDLA